MSSSSYFMLLINRQYDYTLFRIGGVYNFIEITKIQLVGVQTTGKTDCKIHSNQIDQPSISHPTYSPSPASGEGREGGSFPSTACRTSFKMPSVSHLESSSNKRSTELTIPACGAIFRAARKVSMA
jgi:hypothetical protein